MSRIRLVLLCALALAAAPIVFVVVAGERSLAMPAMLHFALVGAVATLTCGASVALSLAGAQARDGRTVLMATAFSTMTALFAVHALATPGMIVGANGVISLAGGLSIPAGALVLGLTALPPLRRPGRIGLLLAGQVLLFAGVLAIGLFGLLDPAAVPAVPTPGSAPAIALLVTGAACLGLLIWRALRTALLTRRAADLAIALGCAWLGAALYANLVIGAGTLGFYAGHFLEIAAVALVSIPAALDIRRTAASRPLIGDLTAQELVTSEEAYFGPRVRALMVRLAARDASTEEHTRRVARLAATVADELKLSPHTRRHLAIGGLLHDIGKLAVPLDILQKPGGLTDDEFAVIKRHPADGRRLLEELGGFPLEVRRLVSDHHERLDGRGYPAGLTAAEMPLETRILAVCDVYDALVSDRVYRAAWTPERAFGLLREESHAYDQDVVEALARRLACPNAAAEPTWVADLGERRAPRPSSAQSRAR
jgi:putative nucleotidyltransferase with HDIG domain